MASANRDGSQVRTNIEQKQVGDGAGVCSAWSHRDAACTCCAAVRLVPLRAGDAGVRCRLGAENCRQLDVLLAFFATTAIFAYIPGPAMLYAAAQTMARGRWSGPAWRHSAFILAAMCMSSPPPPACRCFFTPCRRSTWRSSSPARPIWSGSASRCSAPRRKGDAALPGIEPKSGRRAFFESITVEVLNPKTAIFFMAFLPQFIDARRRFRSGCSSSFSERSSI